MQCCINESRNTRDTDCADLTLRTSVFAVCLVFPSLVHGPSITANAVEGLVKLLHRMTTGEHLEEWLIVPAPEEGGRDHVIATIN